MATRCGFVFLRPPAALAGEGAQRANDNRGADVNAIVARRAYEIYEREGRPEGRQLEHWARAQRELVLPASR